MARPFKKWCVKLSEGAKNQLKKLDKASQERIVSYLENRLLNNINPRSLGSALKGKLNSYWRYRIGDYRLLCILADKTVTIHIIKIGHRREIYEK